MSASQGEVWTEHKHAESGRSYYHEATANKTIWRKPDALLTPSQLATGWSETSHSDGRRYWFNKANPGQTSWTPPTGWTDDQPTQPQEQSQLVSSSFQFAPQRDSFPQGQYSRNRDEYRPNHDRRDESGYRGPIAATPTGVEYKTPEEAEAAFNKLLKKAGVQVDWSWDRAMRETIEDPTFRAIKEPSARKDAFYRYVDNLKIEEREHEKERAAKFKIDFRNMLARHDEIKHYTRWKTAIPMIEFEPLYKESTNETEKRRLFRDYIVELRQNHTEKRLHDHEEALKDLSVLIKEIDLSPDTKWEEAEEKIQSHPSFASDEKYQTLTKSEILDEYVVQIRRLWDHVNSIKQREKHSLARQDRKARDGFKQLIRELIDKDTIQPDSLWKTVYPHFKDDPRYEALIKTCRQGDKKLDSSTPQDLFFDALDDLDEDVEELCREVDDVFRDLGYTVDINTTEEEYLERINSDKALKHERKSLLLAVFKRLKVVASAREEETARERKRQQRKAIDTLRSKIKRLDPAVELEDTWDQVRARIAESKEYLAVEKDEDRRSAYDKHMLRLQDDAKRDKEYRLERERERERRGGPDRNSRDDRYRTSGGRLSPAAPTTSRQQQRGQEYRYEISRREADAQRERAYISRADPFAKPVDLDYGDDDSAVSSAGQLIEAASAKRDRAGSVDADRKDKASKRVKTDVEAGKETEPVEDVAMQSGSEDGEIEEVPAQDKGSDADGVATAADDATPAVQQ